MQLDSSASSIIRAVFAMAGVTAAVAGAQAATRMPAMRRANVRLQEAAHVIDLERYLPSTARRVNDNYNHLMEAPTVFYAVALAIVFAGIAEPIYAFAAWGFVAFRTLHSLIQCTINIVALRAASYGAAWLALTIMIAGPLLAV